MANLSPSTKVSKKQGVVDLFDALPDDLIAHIISFLPFKEAVRSSCLGRRWRYRWLELRRIDLDESHFTQSEMRQLLELDGLQPFDYGLRLSGRRHFLDFVSRFVARYAEPQVESFRLAFSNPKEHADKVRAWVGAMVALKVENLELDLTDPDEEEPFEGNYGYLDLPEEVYGELAGRWLRTMTLTGCDVQPERLGALHALRVLSLSRIAIARDGVEKLTASCPLLEELYLDHLTDTEEITITSASRRLRVLDINECDPIPYGVRLIQVPALELFRYMGFTGNFVVDTVNTLEEAELYFIWDDSDDASELLRDLLEDLNMVTSLTVCSFLLQVVPFADNPWQLSSSKNKVKHLTLDGVTLLKDEIQGIGLLMRSYPQLTSLSIILSDTKLRPSGNGQPSDEEADVEGSWEEQSGVPIPCLVDHLQYVTIENFTGHQSQLKFMKFILKSAKALLAVHIYVDPTPTTGTLECCLEEARKMLGYEKASEVVMITIS
ncbi:hypothetical protein Taro_054528 [Colocasia esculenta]|uniref:F-box domain-containing protein n=1 Tax=Colocasia esculenta TaxID=4460 RepID=A0A843XRG9_COLES|nr:hypothetical protein [Colocasia esculenta]